MSSGKIMKRQDVPFCCACGKVKDELQTAGGTMPWMDMRRYRMKHGFRLADLHLEKTYCPDCAELYRKVQRRVPAKTTTPGRARSAQKV